ncbi:MAG: DHHA1 domain-containing protein [Rhodocyclaceae bacterium]|nr:DHHA1 domain-containing protein [Rhodocyclaceae bacterium]
MNYHHITEPTLPQPVTIIYHAACADGFGAAFAAWKHFGPTARFCPMHHGEAWEPLALTGHDVFILDFSFSRAALEAMAASANSVSQIDHHASARSAWAGLLLQHNNGLEQFNHPSLPLNIIFDLNKSGARLSWEYFHPDTPLPLLLAHIEDSDLWRFAIEGTRAFGRALRLLPFEFALWDQLLAATATTSNPRYQAMLLEGDAIERFFEREVTRLADSRLVMAATLRGEPLDDLQSIRHGQPLISAENSIWQAISGWAINADSLFSSELGHRLAAQSNTFGLIWQLAADGEIKVSLRAAGAVNVAEIASRYGGGGHPNAAGFRLPAAVFFSEVLGLRN